MIPRQRNVLLNRAVFAARPYSSDALTVLTTLFHHFPEAGSFEIFISRNGALVSRLNLRVALENAPNQHNIDMAMLAADEPGCETEPDYLLHVGGFIGFHASSGSDSYSVVVRQLGEREKRTLLVSNAEIPAGDLFAVTLVRPGAYRVMDSLNKNEAVVHVAAPQVPPRERLRAPRATDARERYRPDQATLVEVRKEGFSEKEMRLMAGQSVVFLCNAPAKIQLEPPKEERPREGLPDKKRHVVRRTPKNPTPS
jgi:hypothetical protein